MVVEEGLEGAAWGARCDSVDFSSLLLSETD